MEITLERQSLIKTLSRLLGAVEKSQAEKGLSNVSLHAQSGFLQLRATNLDIEIEDRLRVDVQQSGTTCIDAYLFHEIVKRARDGSMIHLKTSEDQRKLVIDAGAATFDLQILSDAELPTFADLEFSHNFQLKAAQIKRLLDKTVFAVSGDDTRYNISGVHWHQDENPKRLCAVATDGHRLARVANALPEGAEEMPPIIIPRKAASEIIRLIDDDEAIFDISLSDRLLRFRVNETVFTTKLIEGTFPNYKRVIPLDNANKLEAERDDLYRAIERIAVLADEQAYSMKFDLEDKSLRLSMSNPRRGEAVEQMNVSYDGETLTVGLNARYILEVISKVEGVRILLDLADASAAAVIRDPADEDVTFVVMPMRT